jgi:5-methylcytosine-specific restriction endonuclease McrA
MKYQVMQILGKNLIEPPGLTYIEWMRWVWQQWDIKVGGLNHGVECMECLTVIPFSPYHVAHVLSVGTEKQMQRDYQNVIPLCVDCHNIFDAKTDGMTRHDMIIWPQVQEIILMLKNKYGILGLN